MEKRKNDALTGLALRAGRGDAKAFEQLVRETEQMIYNLAWRATGNEADAADLSQEIYIKVWRSLPSFRGEAAFTTWLYRVAQNTACDAARSASRRPVLSLTLGTDSSGGDAGAEAELPDDTETPEHELLRRERASELREALACLAEEHRVILILRDIEGRSYTEISDLLSLEIGTVKSRLSRARDKLKNLLAERNIFPSASVKQTSKGQKD